MKNECYSFDGKELTIIDLGLKLHLVLLFTPILLPEKPKAWESLAEGHMVARWGEREFVVEIGGVPDGQYRLYDDQEMIKAEMFYLKGKLHGPSTYYHENRNVSAKSWYVDGKKQGKTLWFYPGGNIYSIQQFLDGALHGRQEYYFDDGTPKIVLNYEKGRFIQAYTDFDTNPMK